MFGGIEIGPIAGPVYEQYGQFGMHASLKLTLTLLNFQPTNVSALDGLLLKIERCVTRHVLARGFLG